MSESGAPGSTESLSFSARLYGVRGSLSSKTCGDFVELVRSALEASPSVVAVSAVNLEHCYERMTGFRESAVNMAPEEILRGLTPEHRTVTFYPPLQFTVSVPPKNQNLYNPAEERVPDRYEGWWDGSTLLVAWQQSPGDRWSFGAGQFVRDLVLHAMEHASVPCRIQGPSPLHTDLRIALPVAKPFIRMEQKGPYWSELVFGLSTNSHGEALDQVFDVVRRAAEDFYTLQNTLEHRGWVEQATGSLCKHILQLLSYRAELRNTAAHRALAGYWRSRRWRSEARELLMLCWMGLWELSAAKEESADARRQLEEAMSVAGLGPLFERDLSDESPSSAERERELRELIDFVGAQLDTRAVVSATAWGALAGGVAGGLVGWIL